MRKTTSIEVKCECDIPFHREFISGLHHILHGDAGAESLAKKIPDLRSLREAVREKVLFVKVSFGCPKGSWRRLVAAVERVLGKELVGSIRADKAVTLILL